MDGEIVLGAIILRKRMQMGLIRAFGAAFFVKNIDPRQFVCNKLVHCYQMTTKCRAFFPLIDEQAPL